MPAASYRFIVLFYRFIVPCSHRAARYCEKPEQNLKRAHLIQQQDLSVYVNLGKDTDQLSFHDLLIHSLDPHILPLGHNETTYKFFISLVTSEIDPTHPQRDTEAAVQFLLSSAIIWYRCLKRTA